MEDVRSSTIIETLASARQIADYAERLGIEFRPTEPPSFPPHVGAVLADCVLQAGLNYRTVVKGRVDRIVAKFPEAKKLSGVRKIINENGISNFLLWRHPTKMTRFLNLVRVLEDVEVDDFSELRSWVVQKEARSRLLKLNGIGPKTYDYLCCLVGIDCVAVDRHIRTFAYEAGVPTATYDDLRIVVSYAADLLGVSRREFDAWVWQAVSQRHVLEDLTNRPRSN